MTATSCLVRWFGSALCFLPSVAFATDHDMRHFVVAQAQQCQVGPNWSPGANDGEYTFYLPPDVPNPVAIVEATIAAETGWPAGVTAPGGVWFAALDHGQTYLSCSHWPGAQDCPAVGQSQWQGLDPLTILSVGDPHANDFRAHNPPMWYRKGDAIIYQMSCNVPSGSASINGTASFGIITPKYTDSTTCDTQTKLLLHGGEFSNPVNGAPLTTFVSDSSPSWHMMGAQGAGGLGDVTIDTTTATPIPSPAPNSQYSALPVNGSIHFDGTANSIVWTPSSGDFKMGAGDWTIELFWRPGSVAAGVAQIAAGFSTYAPFSLVQIGTSYVFSSSSSGTGWNVAYVQPFGTAALGIWTHLVAERQGNSIYLAQDGVLKATIAVSGALYDPPQSSIDFGNIWGQYTNPATANMQEVRLSKVARYPLGVVTVPTAAFPCP